MPRLLILIVMTLCLACGLVAPTFATDYCPVLTTADDQYCNCLVHNYGTTNDTGVTAFLFNYGTVVRTCGPYTLAPGGAILCNKQISGPGLCGCKVTGEGSMTRTSLVVEDGDGDPHSAVPCN